MSFNILQPSSQYVGYILFYSLVLAFGELSLDQTYDETNPKTIQNVWIQKNKNKIRTCKNPLKSVNKILSKAASGRKDKHQ